MKSRRKQPAATRQAILTAAGALFSRQGYAATGIGAIVERSGLTKGAIFHHFADKRDLALCWMREELAAQVGKDWIEPLEGIEGLAQLIAFWRSACARLGAEDACSALVALAAETALVDEALREVLEQIFQVWRQAIAAVLARGQREGWIHRSIVPQTEAGLLLSLVAGSTVQVKCQQGRGQQEALASAVAAYLETLRPAP